jgi:hypothetical protein
MALFNIVTEMKGKVTLAVTMEKITSSKVTNGKRVKKGKVVPVLN